MKRMSDPESGFREDEAVAAAARDMVEGILRHHLVNPIYGVIQQSVDWGRKNIANAGEGPVPLLLKKKFTEPRNNS